MPGFNTIPASGGGGGILPNMSYVGSIHMSTYNRSWAQGGTAGFYAVYSANQESGYAYFVGSGTTTGVALNRMVYISHSFTKVDVIAPTNDLISVYKVKVKTSSEFTNPFTTYNGGISSFVNVIRSTGNFVLPNNALPLVNLVIHGGGGGSGGGHTSHGGCGGGGGGNVIKLTAFQAVGTTSVTIGGGGSGSMSNGAATYFGNVYALGGGGGGNHNASDTGNLGSGANDIGGRGVNLSIGNGGGRGGYHGNYYPVSNTGVTQTVTTGLGTTGSPVFYGGNSGGRNTSNTTGSDAAYTGGGGGGAGGNGGDGGTSSGGTGGAGHISDIEGSNHSYGAGGRGASASSYAGSNGWSGNARGHGAPAQTGSNNNAGGDSGSVVMRYYIP